MTAGLYSPIQWPIANNKSVSFFCLITYALRVERYRDLASAQFQPIEDNRNKIPINQEKHPAMPQEISVPVIDVLDGNINLGDSMSTAQASDVTRGNNGMTGNNSMNNPGGIGGANGINPAMNAMLANNVMQQQQQAQGMNPQVLQMMMAQGINPMMIGQMGMNNYLPQAMMNPAMGMMGGMGNYNAMGGGNNMNAQGVDNGVATTANNSAPQWNAVNADGRDALAQLMMHPMAMHLISQGINPMMLLGMSLGQMGNANYPSVLNMGMSNMCNNIPDGAGGVAPPMMANTAAPGDGAVAPVPLFAFHNGAMMPGILAKEDGALKYPIINSKVGKKSSKKMIKLKNKPKRPLSAYNFFFREERACILDSIPKQPLKSNDGSDIEAVKKMGDDEDGSKEEEVKKIVGKEDLKDCKAIKKEDVTADDNVVHDAVSEKKEDENGETDDDKGYDQVGEDGKKIPHGKIGFENLAKEIGRRWQQLKPDEMEKFKKLADEDMARYKRDMETFLAKEAQSDRASDGQLPSAVEEDHTFPRSVFKRSGHVGDKPEKKRIKKNEAAV